MAKRVTSKEARSKFSDLMCSVCYGGEEIIVERSGQPVAAIIPVESYERLVAERKARFEIIDRIRSRVPESSSTEIAEDVARAVQKVRKSRVKGRS